MSDNYGFTGIAILPSQAASLGGAIASHLYAYQKTYGRLTPKVPPTAPTGVTTAAGVQLVIDSRNNGWTSGPEITAGQVLVFTATGTVVWESGGSTSSPDGLSDPGLMNAPPSVVYGRHEAVIGQIGGGPIFFIGSAATITAGTSGTLRVRQNDVVTGDNRGYYYVSVRIGSTSQASASWSAPTDTGTSSITGYTVDYSADNGSTWTSGGISSSPSATVSGLSVGTYLLRVAAISGDGVGDYAYSTLTIPAVAPSAPTSVSGYGSDGRAYLSWSPPNDNGGAAVSDYYLQYSSTNGATWAAFDDGVRADASGVVTGLNNDIAYVFRVAAVNSAGAGGYSAPSGAITPSFAGVTTETGETLATETGVTLVL